MNITPLQFKWLEVKALTYELKEAGWAPHGPGQSPLFQTLWRAWQAAVDDAFAFEYAMKKGKRR